MIELLDEMEGSLTRTPWLSGSSFGLADAGALPYVLRLDHLAMAPLLSGDARPRLGDWYRRARSRPSFEVGVSKWAPDFAVDFLRANGEPVWPQVEALARG